jgi:hypothetical protein
MFGYCFTPTDTEVYIVLYGNEGVPLIYVTDTKLLRIILERACGTCFDIQLFKYG